MSKPNKVVSRIAELREKTGLTQAQLAVFVGVTTNTIQNWESGKSGVDQVFKFLKLCAILDCDLEDLIGFVQAPNAEKPKAGSFSIDDLRRLRERWATDRKAQLTSDKESPRDRQEA